MYADTSCSVYGDYDGGGKGIRTPGPASETLVFKTSPFDRSGIPPRSLDYIIQEKLFAILRLRHSKEFPHGLIYILSLYLIFLSLASLLVAYALVVLAKHLLPLGILVSQGKSQEILIFSRRLSM